MIKKNFRAINFFNRAINAIKEIYRSTALNQINF